MSGPEYSVAQLERAGGQLWQRHGLRRVYFHQVHALAGLSITRGPATNGAPGPILVARFGGERTSPGHADELRAALRSTRVYFDVARQAIVVSGAPRYLADRIKAELGKRIDKVAGRGS